MYIMKFFWYYRNPHVLYNIIVITNLNGYIFKVKIDLRFTESYIYYLILLNITEYYWSKWVS